MISVHKSTLQSLVAAVLIVTARSAFANGRFPGADQLIAHPRDPRHMVVRTTFGFIVTRDAGANWNWICEDIVGRIGTSDPPIAVTSDGTIVVAVPFEGVAVTHDDGCTWSRAPMPLAGALAVDVTLEPDDPSKVLVLTSTNDPAADADLQFATHVVETTDNARTWATIGAPLPRDFIATTIEVAASDRRRLYVGGVVGQPPKPALERSDDRGETWTRTMIPAPDSIASVFVSGVDPQSADRLWIRILSGPVDAFGMAPTSLVASSDGGTMWTKVADTTDSMFGFALSPDGAKLAYGGQKEGVFVGPSDGSGALSQVSAIKNRCITWTSDAFYACGTEPVDPFAVGRSSDTGHTFDTFYKLAETCPQACPSGGDFERLCRTPWSDPVTGVAAITNATGETCTVPWAMRLRDAGVDAMPDAAPSEAGPTALEPAGGCSCRSSRAPRAPANVLLLLVAVFALRRRSE